MSKTKFHRNQQLWNASIRLNIRQILIIPNVIPVHLTINSLWDFLISVIIIITMHFTHTNTIYYPVEKYLQFFYDNADDDDDERLASFAIFWIFVHRHTQHINNGFMQISASCILLLIQLSNKNTKRRKSTFAIWKNIGK